MLILLYKPVYMRLFRKWHTNHFAMTKRGVTFWGRGVLSKIEMSNKPASSKEKGEIGREEISTTLDNPK